jgi:Transcriptional regulator, AbiEi antitoxin/Protein of unknown function (DUF559)
MADPVRDESTFWPEITGHVLRGRIDERLGAIAARQYGVVSRTQLLDAGIKRHAIVERLKRGTLHPVHRGVFAVGHPTLTTEGRWLAAVLAAGPGAVLSHRAAGARWEIRYDSRLEVTVPSYRRRPRIHIHRCRLHSDEVSEVGGIPVTGVSRTMFDLAAVVPIRQVERAMHESEVRGLTDRVSLPMLLERYPRRAGSRTIRAILGAGVTFTRSDLEAAFIDFTDEYGLERPETNAWLFAGGHWYEVDCIWRAQRLIVEVDGRGFHETARAFEQDRERDRHLLVAGWRVIRVTWRQIRDEPARLAADLRATLAAGAAR